MAQRPPKYWRAYAQPNAGSHWRPRLRPLTLSSSSKQFISLARWTSESFRAWAAASAAAVSPTPPRFQSVRRRSFGLGPAPCNPASDVHGLWLRRDRSGTTGAISPRSLLRAWQSHAVLGGGVVRCVALCEDGLRGGGEGGSTSGGTFSVVLSEVVSLTLPSWSDSKLGGSTNAGGGNPDARRDTNEPKRVWGRVSTGELELPRPPRAAAGLVGVRVLWDNRSSSSFSDREESMPTGGVPPAGVALPRRL